MVSRVWAGSFEGPEPINIEMKQFANIEIACGRVFSDEQRARIQIAVDDYYLWQSWEWSSPRPKSIKRGLQTLASATAGFLTALKNVQSVSSDTAPYVRDLLACEFTLIPRPRLSHPSKSQDSDIDARIDSDGKVGLDFEGWLNETINRAQLMSQLTEAAVKQLPKDPGGPDDAKNQFIRLVQSLADVYLQAGGELSVTFDPAINGYRHDGFLALVHAAQSVLPEEFRYLGLSLGKVVQSMIAQIK
jgi:hypothetical protein